MKTYIIIFISAFSLSVYSQNDQLLLKQMMAEDTNAIQALALYPENIRTIALEASKNPEVLIRLGGIQKSSSDSFSNLVSSLSKSDQQEIWDLTRYPNLINNLATQQPIDSIQTMLISYPSEIRETVLVQTKKNLNIIRSVNQLNIETDNAFNSLIKEYSSITQNAYRELLKYPEILNILSENMKMTVLVGDIYKRNASLVKHTLDSLNIHLARENAKELETWKKELKNDPEAMNEMQNSAKEFAKEQGYKEDDLEIRQETVVVNYVTYPYPYWFGYPWWYDYAYWYPYPYWYDWGFYFGPYGIVFIGLPSYHFLHWHFHYYNHFYHYPHFTDHCIDHYYGHRNSSTNVTRVVKHWVQTHESELPDNFLADTRDRPQKIKEFGKLEMDYQQYKQQEPARPISKNEFIKQNAGRYPKLNPVAAPEIKREEATPYTPPAKTRKPTWESPPQYPPAKLPPDNQAKPQAPPKQEPRTPPPPVRETPPVPPPKQAPQREPEARPSRDTQPSKPSKLPEPAPKD